MPNELAERGISARLSLLCNKVVLILLKYSRGVEGLTKVDKEILLRGKELILDKSIKFEKFLEGEENEDSSGLWDGMKLYGYTLLSFVDINSRNFEILNLLKEMSSTISSIIAEEKRENINSTWARAFFKSFGEQIMPSRMPLR